jgi:hypothetical protein
MALCSVGISDLDPQRLGVSLLPHHLLSTGQSQANLCRWGLSGAVPPGPPPDAPAYLPGKSR